MPRTKQILAIFLCLAYSLIQAHDFTHIHHRTTGAVLEAAYCGCPCRMPVGPEGCEHAADSHEKDGEHAGNCEIIATPPVLRSTTDKEGLLPQDLFSGFVCEMPSDTDIVAATYTDIIKRRVLSPLPYQNPAPAHKPLRAPPFPA